MGKTIDGYLFRLALVISTSHSRFNDNLANIVVYILFLNRDSSAIMSVSEIQNGIQNKLGLEFTTKEIIQCIVGNASLFVGSVNDKISLSEDGAKKIHESRNREISCVFDKYRSAYEISMSIGELSKLLYSFLYKSLKQNIVDLLTVVRSVDLNRNSELFLDGYSNEQRKIINDFIDWDDKEKNELLFRLIAFAVDYCRLTVKKDANSFNTLLQGKVFYLDANIIFRMMGLNNIERQEVVLRFIEKCKESGIKLKYTSLTRQEILDSISYHVASIKKYLQLYHGKGLAISKLHESVNGSDGFMEAYLKWCGETDGYGKFDSFEQNIKNKFYSCIRGIACEDVFGVCASQEEIDSYFAAKNGKTSIETAKYDIENIHHIIKLRERAASPGGWNTKEYLISADHKLIDWESRTFVKTNPVVVLPSVWYSVILKITGRSVDDERSFVEFIKLRYMQNSIEENVRFIISEVCNRTPDGVLQDKLFTEISESNIITNELSAISQDTITEIVEQTYESVLDSTKNEGYCEGKEQGIVEGKALGYKDGEESGLSRGEKIGRLKQKRDQIEASATERAINIYKRNKMVTIALSTLTFAAMFCIVKSGWIVAFEKHSEAFNIILPLIVVAPVGYMITRLLPLDLELIKKEEHIKIEPLIDEINAEIIAQE